MDSKPPAFQLYAADFYMDTADWSIDEVGLYIRLLFYQWINRSLPSEINRLARIAGCGSQKFKKKWQKVKSKFHLNGDGKLQNLRLENERQKQAKFKQLQSIAGKKGVEEKREKGIYPFKKSSDPSSDPSSGNQALHLQSSSLLEKEKPPTPFKKGGVENPVYLTRKKRKLSGQKLTWFLEFWKIFDYATGRAVAADAWLEIQNLDNDLYQSILTGAKQEALRRPAIKIQGKTPKMAQGWLSGKRWEDEYSDKKPKSRLIS